MYATLKILGVMLIVLFMALLITGHNPLYALVVLLPQAFVAGPICYFEYRHRMRVIDHPIILSSPALAGYVGTLFGFIAAMYKVINGGSQSEVVTHGLLSAYSGFMKFAFVGLIIGAVIYFGKNKGND
jgi:NADH:ubiquinone oxidoreductase subunit 6 (subunit J)